MKVDRIGGALAAAALLLVVAGGCAPELVEPRVDPLTSEEISAERLWERITVEAPYESYGGWPLEEGIQPGQAPHGPFHRIYVNRTLRDAVPIADRTAPYGSIVVKHNLDAGQELVGYTVMAKVEGYAPDTGEWFWARYEPDGSVYAAGAVQSCISCHAGVAGNDYVIVHPLDEPLAGE